MVRWTHTVPDTMVLSSPAVLGGRLFGASCLVDITGNYGRVFCLDAGSGRTLWSRDAVTAPGADEAEGLKAFFSSPALTADGKYLVIGQGLHDDADCSLLCLVAETGRLHWQVRTPLHIEGSPAIWGDLAIAGAAGKRPLGPRLAADVPDRLLAHNVRPAMDLAGPLYPTPWCVPASVTLF